MRSVQRAPRDSRDTAAEKAAPEKPSSAQPRWFDGIARLFNSKASTPSGVDGNDGNALLSFPSETFPRTDSASRLDAVAVSDVETRVAPKVAQSRLKIGRTTVIVGSILSGALLAAVGVARLPILQMTAKAPPTGKLTIDTRPDKLEILVDGDHRGTTPLTLSLAPGAHTVTVRNGSDSRVIPVTIAPGAEMSQYFEMKGTEPAILVGRISVATDPPGARVLIDGKARGISPVTVPDLAPADHKIMVTSDTGTAERTVTVAAGGTASVMFSLPKVAGPVAGWVAISAPFDVAVAEHDDVIGTSGASRIMLAAGRHDIVFTNRSLGYQESRRIEVTAGKTTSIRVEPPKVSISVNARPWAEVTVDGNSVGQTPLANLLVAVGPHELVFRHPQFAERRQTIMVTAKGPNRIATDLSK